MKDRRFAAPSQRDASASLDQTWGRLTGDVVSQPPKAVKVSGPTARHHTGDFVSDTRAKINGRYTVIDRYAVGGAAEIFRAHDDRTNSTVVIKRMRPYLDFDPEVSAGFIREVQLSLLTRDENLIRGIDKGVHDGLDFVVLEYVDGQDLASLIERAKQLGAPIPLALALHIVREILSGVIAIHSMLDERGEMLGLVHRDLTPRNVFIRYDGRIAVADLGASVATYQEPTPSEVVGSVGYLSPEQARLEPLDGRSDIFAVGVMMFELVTGMRAFETEGRSDTAVLKMHQRGALPKMPRDVPEDVAMVIEVATEANREDRFGSALLMRENVDRLLSHLAGAMARDAMAGMLRELFAMEIEASRL